MRQTITNNVDPITLLSLSEVKNYLKVDFDNDDSLITTLINSAFVDASTFTGRSLVPSTVVVEEFFDMLIDRSIYLEFGEIDEVTSVEVDGVADQGFSVVSNNVKFSVTPIENVKITYTTLSELNDDLKIILMKMIADKYEKRSRFVSSESFYPLLLKYTRQ